MNIQLFSQKRRKPVPVSAWQPQRRPVYFASTQRSRWNGFLLTTLSKASYRD